MKEDWRISERVLQIQKSAIHEMTRLSKEIEDVSFLSWAKPTSDTPEHIKEVAVTAIKKGLKPSATTDMSAGPRPAESQATSSAHGK